MALASVVCAMQKLDHLLHPSHSKFLFPISDIESIRQELSYLGSALEKYIYNKIGSKLREDPLEQQIEDAVDKLDDLLESHTAFSESRNSKDEITDYNLLFSQHLLQVKQEISSLTEEVKNTDLSNSQEVHYEPAGEVITAHHGAVSSISGRSGEGGCKFVGLKDELSKLVNGIIRGSNELEIFSIHGMVGIGKTTLVQQIYDHPSIRSCFHTRIFVTLGPKRKMREFLILVLDHIGVDVVERLEQLGNDELKMHLWSYLKNQRYLLVIDDVWDRKLVDKLNMFLFPMSTKSRIILTTRLFRVACCAIRHIYRKNFMNDKESWGLLYRIVFTASEECCSKKLEKIGEKIAQKCEGLPLAIIAIGELLSKNKTVEYWDKVLKDEDPLNIQEDKHSFISRSIYASYEMLPQLLKVCFLNLGVHPKDFIIQCSGLIQLWIAEGFVPQRKRMNFTETSRNFLLELVHANVVVATNVNPTSPNLIKRCRVHFVFRNLCIGEARREKFCHVIKKYVHSFPQGINGQPRWCIHNSVVFGIKDAHDAMQASSSLRSLLFLCPYHLYPLQVPLNFPLLKILVAIQIRFFKFPREVLELVRLKYLSITCDELPESISKLWNLQVLIVSRHYDIKSTDVPAYLPVQIWDLKCLIELRSGGFDLLDPCTHAEGCVGKCRILEHLQTLVGVSWHSCTQGVLARMPNLTKLQIVIAVAPGKVETLSFLGDVTHQLHCMRSFRCKILNPNFQVLPTMPVFPSTVKKLALFGCRFPWEYMSVISSLPSLESLKLRHCAFRGRVWACEAEFLKLKILQLHDLDIEEWIANCVCNPFPKLIYCQIMHCYKLHKLPMNLWNIDTLMTIQMQDCSPKLTTTAKQIQQNHQREYPNARLQLIIRSSWDEE